MISANAIWIFLFHISAHNWTSPAKIDLKKKEKKKMGVKEAFNTDDDEDSSLGSGKKRKLIPLGKFYLEQFIINLSFYITTYLDWPQLEYSRLW